MKSKRRYDPNQPPPAWWDSLDDLEKLDLVVEHHRRARIPLPNERIHAVLHVIVETQVLLGDETPVAATLERMMDEGLSRHEAIHAVAYVLAPLMFEIEGEDPPEDITAAYYEGLRELTAEAFIADVSED